MAASPPVPAQGHTPCNRRRAFLPKLGRGGRGGKAPAAQGWFPGAHSGGQALQTTPWCTHQLSLWTPAAGARAALAAAMSAARDAGLAAGSWQGEPARGQEHPAATRRPMLQGLRVPRCCHRQATQPYTVLRSCHGGAVPRTPQQCAPNTANKSLVVTACPLPSATRLP